MVSLLLGLLVMVVLARWLVPGLRPAPALQPTYEAEIARLRQEVDDLGAQVQRLTDEQQFLMRLLTQGERPAQPPLLPEPQTENPADGDARGR